MASFAEWRRQRNAQPEKKEETTSTGGTLSFAEWRQQRADAEQQEAAKAQAEQALRLAAYGAATGRNPTGAPLSERETAEGYVSWYDRLGNVAKDAEAAQGKGWQAPEDYASTWGGVKQSAGELAQEAGKYKGWWAGMAGTEGMSPEDLYNAITGIESGQRWLGNLSENIDRQGDYYGQFGSADEMADWQYKHSPEYLSRPTYQRLYGEWQAALAEAEKSGGANPEADRRERETRAAVEEWNRRAEEAKTGQYRSPEQEREDRARSLLMEPLDFLGDVAANAYQNFNPLSGLAGAMEIAGGALNGLLGIENDPNYVSFNDAVRMTAAEQAPLSRNPEEWGNLGKAIINTAGAASNMAAQYAFWNMPFSAANAMGAQSALAPYAGYAPEMGLGGSAASNMASRLISTGAKIGMDVLRSPGNFGVALGSGTSSYAEARENGANFSQALTNGLAKGLAEYFSNKLFSGTPFENASGEKGYVTKLTEYVAEKLGKEQRLIDFNKSTGGKLFNWLFDKAGEGLEEVVTGIADPWIDKITYDWSTDTATADELVEEFAGGLLLSLMLAPLDRFGNIRERDYNRRTGRVYKTGQTVTTITDVNGEAIPVPPIDSGAAALIEEGLESPAGTESHELAVAALEQAQAGAAVSDETLGQLAAANEAQIEAEEAAPPAEEAQPSAKEEPVTAESLKGPDFSGWDRIINEERVSGMSESEQAAVRNVFEGEKEPPAPAEPTTPPTEQLAESAKNSGFGAQGVDTIGQFYETGASVGDYFGGFAAYYNAGRAGTEIGSVSTTYGDALTDVQKQAAWNAGRMDAMTENAEVVPYEEVKTPTKQENKPKGGNYFVPGEKNGLPYDIVVEKIPVEETAATAYNEGEKPRALSPEAEKLQKALSAVDRYEIGDYRFVLTKYTGDSYFASIERTNNELMGGSISDARDRVYNEKFPTREEAAAALVEVAENNRLFAKKEDADNGRNAERVDAGRAGVRRRKPGRGGLQEAGEKPAAGESVSGSGSRRNGDVSENEGNAGDSGTRSGRSDDTVRPEQGSDAGHAGTANGEAVSGIPGNSAGGAKPGQPAGRSGEPGVSRSKPRNKNNYRITEDIDSKRPSYSDNEAAIRLLKELTESGRKPTPEEMATLAKFKGWGGLKDILNEYSYYGRSLQRLLTKEEYEAAKLSTLNAHYTSTKVISAMYEAVKRLGFNGGRVLEPSMGVGNFFGMMPEKMARASDLYGVELDSITGNIAKLLYPDAKIDVAGFQDVLYPDGTFDLVIGNVPFSNEIKVPYRGTTYNLHDFFFVKALDETRPGGIVALITSTGTLDKISGKTQKAISDRANLITAFRLPDDAFKTNAGTEVTTDLLFLQRKGEGIEDNGIEFQKIGEIDGIPINEYYVSHPENILGKLAREKWMYASERTVVHGTGQDMQAVLSDAFKRLPRNIMSGEVSSTKPVTAKKRGQRSRAVFHINEDNSVSIVDEKTGETIEYGNSTKAEKEKTQTILDYIKLKSTFMSLLEAESNGADGDAFRKRLNAQYDSFVEKHGPLSSKSNKRLLGADGDYIRTTGMEIKTNDGYDKSDIFRVPTTSKAQKTHADTAEEALSISLNESGRVDLDLMARLTGSTKDELLKTLADEIIQTPDGDYQLVAQYASGNIYQKLDQIKGRPGFERHRKLLEDALPRRKGADEIEASIGAHWIAPKYVQDFIRFAFETGSIVRFNKELGQWSVDMGRTGVKRFSTDKVSPDKILVSTLNGKNVEVKYKDDDGKTYLDEQETKLAQAKQDDLREAFRNWAFSDKDRAEELIESYNRSLNAYAPMNYSALADRIDFGVNPNSRKQPRDYQKAAAARIVFGGNTLLHNGVGTGKTLTMIIAAHALKQSGIAQKPMFVVPNGKVEDFRSEILEAYPDAKILALDNESMTPRQIQNTKSLIATGDWDYVIVYRSAFGLIPLSPEVAAQALQRQLDLYEEAARENNRERNGDKRFEKGLKARMETLRNRIQDLLDKPKDDSTYFDDMGIDALFVDEAHNFKKVGFPTTFNFSGIVADTNEMTTDLYMKEEYMRDRGDRIVLATATPITNAISEMYNMAMHVAPEVYREAGIYSFDTWANTFVNIESQAEIASDGKTFRRKERARNFKNANALFGLYRQFADIKQTKDVVKDLPKAEVVTVRSEGSDLHKQILQYLSGLPVDKVLQMNNDGKAAASDLRLVTDLLHEMGIDLTPEELDLPNSKINKAVAAIVDEYQKSNAVKGTQFVFLDLGIGTGSSKRYRYNLYADLIEKLVKAGIPKSEIAKIGDYDGEDRRQILYDKMNNGEIRVLIGSTAKMGEGVNAQKRAVALHHLSVPYRPDNLEQREGRLVRSGNINKNVRIYRYIQEESYDSYLWQMIERKAAYLAEAYNGGDATEVDELSEAQVNAREAKAIATGNPLIMEKMNLQDKISRLKILYRGWQGEQYDAKRNLEKAQAGLTYSRQQAKNAAEDAKTVSDAKKAAGDKLAITIGKKSYDNRKDAAAALDPYLQKRASGPIGTIYGMEFGLRYFPERFDNRYELYVRGKNEYVNLLGDSAMGNLTRIINLAEKGPGSKEAEAKRAAELHESAIRDANMTLGTPFKQQKELEEAQRRMRVIDAELGVTGNVEEIVAESGDDGVQYSRDGGVTPHPDEWTARRVGDSNKKPMSTADIVEKIRHDFGINVTTGHVRGQGVRGQYNPQDQGIRIRIENSLPDLSHELGHHLDNMYDLVKTASATAKKELTDNLSDEKRAEYSDKQLPGEGMAEFVRRFLQNRETAAIDYPEFTAHFLNSLSGPDQARIEVLADEINAYYSLDSDTAQSSIVRRADKLPDARTWTERVKDKAGVFYQAFVDSNYGIKRFDEATGSNAYKLATISAYADNRAGAALVGDLYDAEGAYVCPGLKSCFAGYENYLSDKKLYADLNEYLVVKHGPERLAEGKRVFSDDRKNSTAWMNRRQMELERQHPEIEEISDRLYQFQRAFLETWGVNTGLVTRKAFDEWGERWEYYVPFNRAVSMEQRGIGVRRGFANQNSTIKKAVGSGKQILSPVDNIIHNMVLMVNAGLRNNVMRRIRNGALSNGDATFMEKVQMTSAKQFDLTGIKKELSESVGEALLQGMIDQTGADVFDLIIDRISDVMTQFGRGKAHGNIVTVMVNGKPEFWKINDPQLLESITSLSPKKMGAVMEAYATVSRFMTGNITGNNLLWSIFSNFPRDLMTLFTYAPVKNPLKVFSAMGSAYLNAMRGDHADAIYKEYLAMGGGQGGSAYTADLNLEKRIIEKLHKKGISANPLDWISWASDRIEMGPRFATYKLLREAGMSPEEAFYGSQDVTVNFRKGGRIARELNKVIPFFNAGVQGLDKFGRWITANDVPRADRAKVRRGRMIGFLTASAVLAALFYALNNRDDKSKKEYQQLSNYTKNSYWNIPLGDGKYFAIPKPRELAVLSSFFETCMERFGGNEHAYDEFYEYATDTILPNVAAELSQGDFAGAIGSLGIIGVGADLMANRDFLGRPIVSSGLQNLEPKDQYTSRTSMIARAIGEAFNVSPQKVDFFFSQVLGGWWKAQKALFPVGGEEMDLTMGIQNSYIKDNQYSTDLINRLYDYAASSQAAKNSAPDNADKALRAKLDSNMTTFYSRYYALARENGSSTAERGTRQEVLDMIAEYTKAREHGYETKTEKDVYRIAKESGEVGTYLPSVMPVTVKDGKEREHSLSDVQYVQYQLDYNTAYWQTIEAALPRAKNDTERAAIIKAAKQAAKDRATERLLRRLGAPLTGYNDQYKGVTDTQITVFRGLLDVANDDGSLKQEEVIDILDRMQDQMRLSDEAASALFHTRYDSDKNNPYK